MKSAEPLLIARAQLGDLRSLDRVLASVQDPLFRHISFILRDDDAACDVLQDVLLTISRKLGELREPLWFKAWAFRIATRAAIRHARRTRQLPESSDPADLAQVAIEPELPAFDPELVAALLPVLGEVSPKSRIVLRLHYLEGLTLAEVAEALDVSVGTVKSRLAYGLNAMRERIPAVRL